MTDRKTTKPKQQKTRKPSAQQRKQQSQRDKARAQTKDTKSVAAPVAKTKIVKNSKPKIKTLANGDCHIKHREYVMDITANNAGPPTTFKVETLPVNVGQQGTFQWLSRIAANYESYVFDDLSFCYETEASTSLGGTLVLTLDYDASDPAPTSKQQAMAYRSAVRSAPWTECRHKSTREDLRKNKTNFVRIGAQPPNTDIKTYDVGNLFVISQGVGTASATLGELYVEYSVTLMTPVFEGGSSIVPVGGTVTGTGALTAGNPLGNGTGQVVAPSYGFTVNSASVITFPNVGTYLLVLHFGGTTMAATSVVAGSLNQIVGIAAGDLVDAGATNIEATYSVHVIQPGSVTVTCTAATVTNSNAYIGSVPEGSI